MPKKASAKSAVPPNKLPIFVVRGQRVILDADLARIYGVPTKVFNQTIKRNRERFPEDFAFQLTAKEVANLRSQIATSSKTTDGESAGNLTSQFVISRLDRLGNQADEENSSQFTMSSHGGRRSRPWAFTEHGALMAANLLRSERAVGAVWAARSQSRCLFIMPTDSNFADLAALAKTRDIPIPSQIVIQSGR